MIPKIIHYCWFGRGEMPKLMKKCIKSWKKFCPDWEVVLWNEDSFDVKSTLWTKQAYEAKKYAFVSDYVRLKALYEMGGVYLDTDVELVQNLDVFTKLDGYVGFACNLGLSTGLIGAAKAHPFIQRWFEHYHGKQFHTDQGDDMLPNTEYSTQLLLEKGLQLNDQKQTVFQMTVYPQTYFCPLFVDSFRNLKSKHTYAIHYFSATWRKESERKAFQRAKWRQTWIWKVADTMRYFPKRIARKMLGDDNIERIKKNLGK